MTNNETQAAPFGITTAGTLHLAGSNDQACGASRRQNYGPSPVTQDELDTFIANGGFIKRCKKCFGS